MDKQIKCVCVCVCVRLHVFSRIVCIFICICTLSYKLMYFESDLFPPELFLKRMCLCMSASLEKMSMRSFIPQDTEACQ